MTVLRRVRAFLGQLLLLAVLAGLTAFLVTGPARLANGRTDDGLRGDLRKLAATNRDLTFSGFHVNGEVSAAIEAGRLEEIQQQLPAPLPGLIGGAWYIAESGQNSIVPAGAATQSCPNLAVLRYEPATTEAFRIVGGRAAASRSTTEVVIGQDAAQMLGLEVGDGLEMGARYGSAPLRVVGVFAPVNPDDPIWSDQMPHRAECPSPLDGLRQQAVLLTDQAGARLAGNRMNDLTDRWRYRLDENRITADQVDGMTRAVATIRRTPPDRTSIQSSVDSTLADFDRQVGAVRALLAVVQAGILATAAGLILLAARLMTDRRRAEFALLRARGGTVGAVAGRTLLEVLVVVPIAVAAGWIGGTLAPGRADDTEPLLLAAVAVIALLAAPISAALVARRPSFSGHRSDVVALRPSLRRITAEGLLVLLAAGGIYLVRLRGLDAGAGVDPYLVAAPVLLALAASVVALRGVPFPLRWAGDLAARARGAIAFLGLSGAGRAPLHSGPLAVLVVAIATGLFTGTVTSTVGTARDRAANLAVPADAVVRGFYFSPETAPRIAALPHVTKVVPMLLASGATIHGDTAAAILQGQVMVVDASSAGLDLPAALTGARRSDGPAPAVVSPHLAAQVGTAGTAGTAEVMGRTYRFTVAQVSEVTPGLPAGTTDFIVLPQQALAVPDYQPIQPNRILIDGHGFDAGQVRAIADAGQREQLQRTTGKTVTDAQLAVPATVVTWDSYRESLEQRGVDGALSFTFVTGMVAAAVLSLMAVALAVLTGAPARGRTLSRLRTMGLSPGQGRRLLVFELVPLIAVAVIAGGLAGFALPLLIGPALGLSGFTAGVAAGVSLDPWFAGGVLALAVLAVVAALAVENVANRRLRLGTVLRLGEEQS
ncbi:membrane protein [Actinoplanes cyaneus]|uniref:Membrane protein n=1 Tax=Actinoplanes cyaneus TaxID=52696 RepID=A0A919IFW6_9ACTN|nr:FtsX-like permease family protein [Actinoplanes cyaneus]MCW2137699.1 putative ABC transport system permease protein [Actinoplanes cyaneus]GID65094.1 membrane protein [Actinoplanes cyaneus]